MNVSFPVIFGHASTMRLNSMHPPSFTNDTNDFNIFYGSKKPNIYFRSIKETVDFTKTFIPINLINKHPLYPNSITAASQAYDSDEIASNGIAPGKFLQQNEYDWFKARSLDELENTVYFTNGFIHSLNYMEPGAYPFFTFDEWRITNGNETHSILKDPEITSDPSYRVSFSDKSPATTLGIKGFDFSLVSFPTNKILFPKNNGKYNISSLPLNIFYNGMPLKSCMYRLGESSAVNFNCGKNVSELSFQEGNFSWTFFLQDELGGVRSAQTNFSIDTTLPVVTVSSPTSGKSIVGQSFTLETLATEAHPDFTAYTLSNSSDLVAQEIVQGARISKTFTNLPYGIYSLIVRAQDQYGNTHTLPTISFTLAQTASLPETPVQPPSQGGNQGPLQRSPTTFAVKENQLKAGFYQDLIQDDALSIEVNKKFILFSIKKINTTGMLVMHNEKSQMLEFAERYFLDLDKDGTPDALAQVRFIDTSQKDAILWMGKYIPLSLDQPLAEPLIPTQNQNQNIEQNQNQDETHAQNKEQQQTSGPPPTLPSEQKEKDADFQKMILLGLIIFIILACIVAVGATIWRMTHKPNHQTGKIYFPELR